jgi:lipopolysaccharide export system permease protein
MSSFRLYRYFLREASAPMVLGLTVLTLVLLMGRLLRLMELVVNKGVPLREILTLVACLLPGFLIVSLPLSFLLGIMMGFGRLSADGEILAMKSSGIGLWSMTKPILGLGLLVSLMTAGLTTTLKPIGERVFRQRLFQITTSRANIGIMPQIFNNEFPGLVLYANEADERSGIMTGVFISDERADAMPSLILARTGQVLSNPRDLTLTLRLENGTLHRQSRQASGRSFQVIGFATYDINLDLTPTGNSLEQGEVKQKEMKLDDLHRALKKSPAAEERRQLRVDFHERLSLAVAPLLFALLGAPLGIQPLRSGRGSGFAVGLLVFLTYYLLHSLANTLTSDGALPVFALWLPNLLFLLAALVTWHRANQERPLPLAATCGHIAGWLAERLRRWEKPS